MPLLYNNCPVIGVDDIARMFKAVVERQLAVLVAIVQGSRYMHGGGEENHLNMP